MEQMTAEVKVLGPPYENGPGPVSQGFPFLLAQTSLTQDGTQHSNRDIARMHGDGDAATIRSDVSGVPAGLPAEGEPRSFQLSDYLPGPERPKRHREEALPAGRALPPASPR